MKHKIGIPEEFMWFLDRLNFDAQEIPMPEPVTRKWRIYKKEVDATKDQTYCVFHEKVDKVECYIYYTHYFIGERCASAVYLVANDKAKELPLAMAHVINRLCGLHISHPETLPSFLEEEK